MCFTKVSRGVTFCELLYISKPVLFPWLFPNTSFFLRSDRTERWESFREIRGEKGEGRKERLSVPRNVGEERLCEEPKERLRARGRLTFFGSFSSQFASQEIEEPLCTLSIYQTMLFSRSFPISYVVSEKSLIDVFFPSVTAGILEKEDPSSPNRSRTNDLPITSSIRIMALPLKYRRLWQPSRYLSLNITFLSRNIFALYPKIIQ